MKVFITGPLKIGIFDSGIGGLTVARAITRNLPHLPLIYFGDTAHLPYGDKSAEAIQKYSVRIAGFLLAKKCNIIVIACNTASSLAFQHVKNRLGNKTRIFNVIDPVTEYVANNFRKNKIGVIGTKGTVNSRVYARKIIRLNHTLKVTSLATPLLAPMIEEGYFNNYISRTIIHSYLSKKSLQKIRLLILACTHYPLIKKEVEEFYGKTVQVVDSAGIVAKYIKAVAGLSEVPLRNRQRPIHPKHYFYVSDYTKAFERSAKIFFGKNIRLKKVNLWK